MTKFIDVEIKQNNRDEFFLTKTDGGALVTIKGKFLYSSKKALIEYLKKWNGGNPDTKYIVKNVNDKDPIELEKVAQP